MDEEQIEVSVEGSQHVSNFGLLQINSSWREHEIAIYNDPRKEIWLKVKSNCNHFSNKQRAVLHMLAPSVHYLLN